MDLSAHFSSEPLDHNSYLSNGDPRQELVEFFVIPDGKQQVPSSIDGNESFPTGRNKK